MPLAAMFEEAAIRSKLPTIAEHLEQWAENPTSRL
jgi:hypothetical protein